MLSKINRLQGRSAKFLGEEQALKSAVILPLVNIDNKTCIIFEKRASHLAHQPGEISFPGGKIEPTDGSPRECAIRETCEELELQVSNIEVIAELDIMVSPFNMIVYPFVAYIDDVSKVKANPDEVEEVFYVPLNYLLENAPMKHNLWFNIEPEADFPFELIPHGKNYPFRKAYVPQLFWLWHEHVIWGLTARILNNFIALLKSDEE